MRQDTQTYAMFEARDTNMAQTDPTHFLNQLTTAAILWVLALVLLTKNPKVQYEMYVAWHRLMSFF